MDQLASCIRCGYTTTKKAYLLNHLRKKTKCAPLMKNISVDDVIKSILIREPRSYNAETGKYAFNYCKKEFVNSNGKYQHKKRCPVKNAKKPEPPPTDEHRIHTLEQQLEIMQLQLSNMINTFDKRVDEEPVIYDDVVHDADDADNAVNQPVLISNVNVAAPTEPDQPRKHKSKTKEKIPHSLRIAVWEKHIGLEVGSTKCMCCKTVTIMQLQFECGHIDAESLGEQLTTYNLLPVCGACNRAMYTTNLVEFRNRYFAPPTYIVT